MINNSIRVLSIIHLALMGSVGIYGVIIYQITLGKDPQEIPPAFLYALCGVAASTMVLIPILRGKLMPPMKAAASLQDAVPEGEKVQQALARVSSASIVSWALCESIGIYGVVISFITFQPKYFLGFAAASLVNFLLYRPSREQLMGAARAAE